MKNPCESCITKPICLSKSRTEQYIFFSWVLKHCQLFYNYVMTTKNIINKDKANELGKIFNYRIDGNRYLFLWDETSVEKIVVDDIKNM